MRYSAYEHTTDWLNKDDKYTLVDNPTVPDGTPSWLKQLSLVQLQLQMLMRQ